VIVSGQESSRQGITVANTDLIRLKANKFDPVKFVVRSKHRWVTPEHAQELLRVIKPSVNQHLRAPMCEVLGRYMAGDGQWCAGAVHAV